ncbi:phosphoadenylyl-sulfate reductase [Amylibacter sp. IMCC11727]|uniref:phosphoadenylyl-sulfate reductase n=1 Tax=Amylibacter sp. IMCC11727 TaxID=3039851 RepID=UPI00244E1B00|nr:phosphoadenylyl-sulfate reductase [Amylibacter sp. IMCC11727]WGI20781.1 phosphoadenylyl-sulfate reductase [Amylibacter sp. IMCC11727]
MPFESAYLSVPERVELMNFRYRNHAAIPVLGATLSDPFIGKIALVSSFGAESVVLLHLVSLIKPDTPVIMIDTEMLFPETLDYQAEVADRLNLTDVRIIRAPSKTVAEVDPDGTLHQSDPDACCALRKTEPLQATLEEFDGWITGRKRYQNGQRKDLDLFEVDTDHRFKINPLAHWRQQDLTTYMENNALPRHPLVAKGYPSIGCAPCTSPVAAGEDPRSGRWRGQDKVECGIHFGADGTVVRG